MDGARLQLLDGFGLETVGARLGLPLSIQRTVAFVALFGPAHRSVIAGTLWRDVPEAQALASLRTCIWRIHRHVPGLVRAEGVLLSLAASTLVDSREQESFATRVLRGHHLDDNWLDDEIQSLWRGELLPGWYEDWVVSERERLSQLRLHALERLASALATRGKLDTALELALEAVRSEPLRETANAALISVYLAEGNVCDALHQYQVFAERLRRELGLDPSASLGSLLPSCASGIDASSSRSTERSDATTTAGTGRIRL